MSDEKNSLPSQFQIFRSKSALRIQLDKPDREDQKYKVGCLYLQAAPAREDATKNDRGYLWESSKISVKLGVNDITSILYNLRLGQGCDLFHSFGDSEKSIKFQPKEGGGYFLNLEERVNKDKNNIMVPISQEEIEALVTMLTFALPLIHNWL